MVTSENADEIEDGEISSLQNSDMPPFNDPVVAFKRVTTQNKNIYQFLFNHFF